MTSRSERLRKAEKHEAEKAFLDANDIDCARAEINGLIADGFLKHGPGWITAWLELGLKWSESSNPSVRPHVTLPKSSVTELVRRARADAEVFALAKMVIASRVQKESVGLPRELKELNAQILVGGLEPPKSGRGPKHKHWGRNYIIARAMQIAESRWDKRFPNRRKDSDQDFKSISQITHEALIDTEIDLVTVDSIQRIYSRAKADESFMRTTELLIDWMFDDADDVDRI